MTTVRHAYTKASDTCTVHVQRQPEARRSASVDKLVLACFVDIDLIQFNLSTRRPVCHSNVTTSGVVTTPPSRQPIFQLELYFLDTVQRIWSTRYAIKTNKLPKAMPWLSTNPDLLGISEIHTNQQSTVFLQQSNENISCIGRDSIQILSTLWWTCVMTTLPDMVRESFQCFQ